MIDMLKYEFCKRLLRYKWKSDQSVQSTDLEKKWGQKGSIGQRFIFTEVTSYKIHILVWSIVQHLDIQHFLYNP